jgi:hypothetical protein
MTVIRRSKMSGKTTIHIGDLVQFRYGRSKVIGTVKEDRGPIGVKGRHLYLIYFSPEPEYSSQIELPADQIELVKGTVSLGEDS